MALRPLLRPLLLAAALFSSIAAPLHAEETQRYLIAPRKAASASRLRIASDAIAASARHRVRTFNSVDAFAADLTPSEASALAAAGDLIVEQVVPRYALDLEARFDGSRALAVESGTAQDVPWGISAIHAAQVWPFTRGEQVNVVVVDTGIDILHPDLGQAYAGGFNAVKPGELPVDDHGHGTHVAGTIAAANNGFGVVGVAPRVKLWAVKALDADGEGSSEEFVAALEWTIAKARATGGRWIVNASLGAARYSEIEERAVGNVADAGIVVVAAAGNDGTATVMYPAGYRGAIAVGAVTQNGGRAVFSSFGSGLALLAPGAAVRSTLMHGRVVSLNVKNSDGTIFPAWRIGGSPYASVTGKVYDCGVGEPHEFPAGVRGNIALVRRGKYSFRELARNANEAAAGAVIIVTYANDLTGPYNWSFLSKEPDPEWDGYNYPLAVGVHYGVGESILRNDSRYTVDYATYLYGAMSGTSMAAPHVTGTAALMLSLAPELPASSVASILRYTARDMYAPGWDPESGWGALDALSAAQWVAPEKFGVPPPKPPKQGRRRSVR
ncbi:MAG TPA: S8 family serine peptidase [Thermoanaerobaculia bacterium]|nr:S8 family serine peptidase [Thermoanaerobaculia bacterium]